VVEVALMAARARASPDGMGEDCEVAGGKYLEIVGWFDGVDSDAADLRGIVLAVRCSIEREGKQMRARTSSIVGLSVARRKRCLRLPV